MWRFFAFLIFTGVLMNLSYIYDLSKFLHLEKDYKNNVDGMMLSISLKKLENAGI